MKPSLGSQPGKILVGSVRRKTGPRPTSIHRDLPGVRLFLNDNYCLNVPLKSLDPSTKSVKPTDLLNVLKSSHNSQKLSVVVNSGVVGLVPSVKGQPQKKGISPVFVPSKQSLKYVNNAFCVDHSCSVRPVPNVPNVVPNLPVGARLSQFWETWDALGASPKVVQMLREGYTLPFQTRPNLTRSPRVVSCYVHPHRNLNLIEALHQLTNKNAVELVQNQSSLGFYNRLFLVPKPNKWRPILDLSNLNTFLKAEKFKMETPETIRTSLQTGEWVTSIDFKDAYFHIPIQPMSRKYLRFHVQGQTYQFKALSFGLSTAPLEFTVVTKEVKLMALQKGIRIHQYLDDWLVRAKSHHTCLQHTQTLVALCQDLGWLVNKEKSELVPKQVFDFVGYQFDLKQGKVRPTLERWQNLSLKIRSLLTRPTCPVRQWMSLIGLLTATEKQVHLGRLHMRPIQWHLKKQLEDPRVTGENNTSPQINPSTSKVVAGGKQCAPRATFTPTKTCSATVYRCLKRRLGRSLRRAHCKGNFQKASCISITWN